MSDWVWVRRGDGLGRFAIDLHTCTEFIVADEYADGWYDEWQTRHHAFYFAPDLNWYVHISEQ
jgi:hypothetical protein